ncbi:putative serine/threonine-protein kinase [Cinnamomum micranthum f. kanehirae]|uniref:Putative serine/threonine-protein kinase n=1 Tax=Cinnamomum micranthum f. kanehirae TaxID=337451 RepID=A0A3S3NIS0_9MAGN|nr:putative serine/threonine-protein kinase [Cinnamomum micranthum f. kanehirae]
MASRRQIAYAEAGNVMEQAIGSIRMASPSVNAFAAGQATAYKVFETVIRKPQIDASDTGGIVLEDIKGDIELRNVSLSYPARSEIQVFLGFSLNVPSGTTAALVGESGSGKSTVISLVERFYDPQDGEVLIDGINLKKLRLGWIREKIGLVASHVMLGIAKHEQAPPTSQRHLSPMVEACSRMDLTAIHQILVMTHYRDDERTNELSFQEWTQQMRDTLRQGSAGTLLFMLGQWLCYLLCDQPDAALRDAMTAHCVYLECPTAFYMLAVALAKLQMLKDAAEMLNEAAGLEKKRQRGGRGS